MSTCLLQSLWRRKFPFFGKQGMYLSSRAFGVCFEVVQTAFPSIRGGNRFAYNISITPLIKNLKWIKTSSFSIKHLPESTIPLAKSRRSAASKIIQLIWLKPLHSIIDEWKLHEQGMEGDTEVDWMHDRGYWDSFVRRGWASVDRRHPSPLHLTLHITLHPFSHTTTRFRRDWWKHLLRH